MTRSSEIKAIFDAHVNQPVFQDSRSMPGMGKLGYPDEFICRHVMGRGLANFSQGFNHPTYGSLTADDLVLLYCFFNMKLHFDTASAVFIKHQADFAALFSADGRTMIVDIGCGPGTACLALTDLLRNRDFDYFGIDSSAPMRNKACDLCRAAQEASLIGAPSTFRFAGSWNEICLESLATDTSVILIFSYFFASHSLFPEAIESLVQFVRRLQNSPVVKNLVMTYINSSVPAAGRRYGVFKRLMRLDSKVMELGPRTNYELLRLKETN